MDCDANSSKLTEQVTSPVSTDARQGYRSKTLQTNKHSRCRYLPIFPTVDHRPIDCLLLANVPGSYLDVSNCHKYHFINLIFMFI